MVPLTNLDARDKLPCPLEITPKVEGKCKWTNGNVLEFVPTKSLELATKYHLRVTNIAGLLYPLINTLEEDILTPELTISTDTNSFDPVRGLVIKTSAPVDETALASALTLTSANGDKIEAKIARVTDNLGIMSETDFIVTPRSGAFLYASSYGLQVAKGLKPKYGTEALATDFKVLARSADFLSSSEVYRKIYSASGELIDTRSYDTTTSPLIPSENVFFRQTFMAEVGLDKNLFTLKTASGNTVDFSLAYVKQPKYDEHGNNIGEEENKRMIDITPSVSLEPNSIYTFTINKQANSSLASDAVKTYKTAPKLQVVKTAFLSNTESCVYLTNPLGNEYEVYSPEFNRITTVPASKVHDLMLDGQMNWQTNTKTYRCQEK